MSQVSNIKTNNYPSKKEKASKISLKDKPKKRNNINRNPKFKKINEENAKYSEEIPRIKFIKKLDVILLN